MKKSFKIKKYSNFITPPDFVNDKFHTVTVIDALIDEIELLGRMCQFSNESYNIYLYRSDMHEDQWLYKAVDISDAVIINTSVNTNESLFKLNKVYYYGDKNYVSPAHKVNNILQYFLLRQEKM